MKCPKHDLPCGCASSNLTLEKMTAAVNAIRLPDWRALIPSGRDVTFDDLKAIGAIRHIRIEVYENVPRGSMFLADRQALMLGDDGPMLMVNADDLRKTVEKIQGMSE